LSFYILLILSLFQTPDSGAKTGTNDSTYISPFAKYSPEWNNRKYAIANTAANANYMTDTEKMVIYVLNLIRLNPSLFCETVLKPYPNSDSDMAHYNSSEYFASLVNTLTYRQQPLGILYPDSLSYVSALCHAQYSGSVGYVGHDRSPDCNLIAHFHGECCDYGFNTALDIVIDLLIDEDEPDLGHREICLDPKFNKLGVSIRPHSVYKYNTVMDFY
jgi:uncharacterized protein YkwD